MYPSNSLLQMCVSIATKQQNEKAQGKAKQPQQNTPETQQWPESNSEMAHIGDRAFKLTTMSLLEVSIKGERAGKVTSRLATKPFTHWAVSPIPLSLFRNWLGCNANFQASPTHALPGFPDLYFTIITSGRCAAHCGKRMCLFVPGKSSCCLCAAGISILTWICLSLKGHQASLLVTTLNCTTLPVVETNTLDCYFSLPTPPTPPGLESFFQGIWFWFWNASHPPYLFFHFLHLIFELGHHIVGWQALFQLRHKFSILSNLTVQGFWIQTVKFGLWKKS